MTTAKIGTTYSFPLKEGMPDHNVNRPTFSVIVLFLSYFFFLVMGITCLVNKIGTIDSSK